MTETPFRTTLEVLRVENLRPAPWNYKKPGDAQQIRKLQASIARDRSMGVMAVRALDGGSFEVIDGNHRLEAVRGLGWEVAPCENFGQLALAEAITIAARRNHAWFEDDLPALSKLFREEVIPTIGIDELATFMPQERQQLEDLAKLSEFDWSSLPYQKQAQEPAPKGQSLTFPLTDEIRELWDRWRALATRECGAATDDQALVQALRIAIDGVQGVS